MGIQAIIPASMIYTGQTINTINPVQDIKKPEDYVYEQSNDIHSATNNDGDKVVISSSEKALEAKYDIACRLAGYYKSLYEDMLQNGCCVA